MKTIQIKLLLSLFLLVGVTQAKIPDNSEEIKTHLEFLGFEVTFQDAQLVATHDTRLGMSIEQWEGGLLCTNFFNPTTYALKNLKNFMRLINNLNSNAGAARYYLNDNDKVIIEAYYPGEYNKKSFSAFLDIWEKEMVNIANIIKEMPNYVE
jgi:hypothetical protein